MPRFQALASHEIREKSPGEIVTIADEECEVRLSEGLSQIMSQARIVGEEAATTDPSMLDVLDEGMVWLIDPIDGTTNFAEGKAPFALMVALLNSGETEAGWIYDPVTGRMCHASRGNGAYINDYRVATQPSSGDLPIAAIATHFLTQERRELLESRAEGRLAIAPIPRCAGEQYPRLVTGQNDVSLFERSLPWDHAPGVLFLDEAGGKTARKDRSPFMAADRRPGLLSAASPLLWETAANILLD
jgi:fructose-1,6-bisphosphatase/inositol monophosphatase family enzyme